MLREGYNECLQILDLFNFFRDWLEPIDLLVKFLFFHFWGMMRKFGLTKRYKRIMLVMALTLLAGSAAKAEDDANSQSLGVGFTLDYFSKYIWRGQNLNNESVFQPSMYFSKYGFTGTIWSTQDWTSVNGESGEFTEVDYSLEYTNVLPWIDGVDWFVGVIYYDDTTGNSAEDTTEVYGGLTFSKLPLAPTFTFYRDIDVDKGTYYQFSISHTIEKIAKWKDKVYCDLVLGASLGYGNSAYNKGNFDVSGGNFNDLTISAALPVFLGKCWIIKPSINYSTMLAGPISDATEMSDNMWFGVGLSADF